MNAKLHCWYVVMLLVYGYTVSAIAQTPTLTREEARLKLTGGSSKEWVLVRVESFMGVRTKCRQGETYVFHADWNVTHMRCVAGDWQKTTERWSLADLDELDRELIIGKRHYLLLLRDTNTEEQARLRTRSQDKAVPSVDQILRHELE